MDAKHRTIGEMMGARDKDSCILFNGLLFEMSDLSLMYEERFRLQCEFLSLEFAVHQCQSDDIVRMKKLYDLLKGLHRNARIGDSNLPEGERETMIKIKKIIDYAIQGVEIALRRDQNDGKDY